MSNWFIDLTGFRERDAADVATEFTVDGSTMTSRANGRTMTFGRFETPSLQELRAGTTETALGAGPLQIRHVIADVKDLHLDSRNAGAMFQAASQFNALEMVNENRTPEDGVTDYEFDDTQGPACAVACGAGTIYRNYLVPLGSQRGQSATVQVDCLADLRRELGIQFEVRNGYAWPTAQQLAAIASAINERADGGRREELLEQHRIAVQWNTEVTWSNSGHLVSQAYCSAVPIGYCEPGNPAWEPLARLILDAAYESTLHAASINTSSTGNATVFLTALGGGVFRNPKPWIYSAMSRALRRFADVPLDVVLVGRSAPSTLERALLDEFS